MRHILLKIATGEVCQNAEEYDSCAHARWNDLHALFANPESAFYKNVYIVHNIESEAFYEDHHWLVFEVLLTLESITSGTPDVSKPLLRKAIEQLCAKGDVLSKRVVPEPSEPAFGAKWKRSSPEPPVSTNDVPAS